MQEFIANGVQGVLVVTPTKVIIRRKGVGSFFTHGLQGDKEIRIDQISSIQFKNAGQTNGYIQLAFIGGSEAKGGLVQAASDENTVMFTKKHQPDFLKAKELIERKAWLSSGTRGR